MNRDLNLIDFTSSCSECLALNLGQDVEACGAFRRWGLGWWWCRSRSKMGGSWEVMPFLGSDFLYFLSGITWTSPAVPSHLCFWDATIPMLSSPPIHWSVKHSIPARRKETNRPHYFNTYLEPFCVSRGGSAGGESCSKIYYMKVEEKGLQNIHVCWEYVPKRAGDSRWVMVKQQNRWKGEGLLGPWVSFLVLKEEFPWQWEAVNR